MLGDAIVRIPHAALIVVGDGKRTIFLRNEGDATFLNLVVEQTLLNDNPATHLQGTDKPGRVFTRAGGTHRSSVEATDWHHLSKLRFAREVAGKIDAWLNERASPAVVIVATTRTLTELRRHLSAAAKTAVIAEIAKDLTRHPVAEIERLLVAG